MRTYGSTRGTRAWGYAFSLVVIVWLSARFQARPLLPKSLHQVAALLVWTLLLGGSLDLVARLTPRAKGGYAGAYLKGLGLVLFGLATFALYLNDHRVGPLDAQWYQNAMNDFLIQYHRGTFPVLVGESTYAFNGAVHPFRSAPWQFVLAAGIDELTGRSLAAVAIQHLVALLSYVAGLLIAYVGMARRRPERAGLAGYFALALGLSPGVTVLFFQYDMYMTLTALPAMAAALVCVEWVMATQALSAYGWLAVSLAALWYCHPPMALLTNILCGAIVAADLCIRGPGVRRLFGVVVAAGVFYLLAAPYFRSMAEITGTESSSVRDLAMPALGLGLVLAGVGGWLRGRRIGWLALVTAGLFCLQVINPSLVPFAALAAALAIAAGFSAKLRQNPEWVAIVASLAGGFAAVAFFPKTSFAHADPSALQAVSELQASSAWLEEFQIMYGGHTHVQLGYLLIAVVCAMVTGLAWCRSVGARWFAAACVVLAIALGHAGPLSRFFWGNTPGEITRVVSIAYSLRLMPVFAVVAAVGGFFALSSLPRWPARAVRCLRVCLGLLLAWSISQLGMLLYSVRNYHLTEAETAVRNRPENVALERYAWDLLPPPEYIDFGVMDAAIESRFWAKADLSRPALIDPGRLEEALESPGTQPIGLVPTPFPNAAFWLEFSPRIELKPGQRVLLRFDFLGHIPSGCLMVSGQSVYREYFLPQSGRGEGFGYGKQANHTLSILNSGDTTESLDLQLQRNEPGHASDPTPPGPYWNVHVAYYNPDTVPIYLKNLLPYDVRINAPQAGYLETFRSWIPGYKAFVDGKPARILRSKNALVMIPVPAGRHDVLVRFAGTVALHTAVRWACITWLLTGVIALISMWLAAKRTPLLRPISESPLL